MKLTYAFILGSIFTSSLACQKQSIPAPAMAEAKDIFAQRCALCHGADGRGDGAAAATLTPKPRNYTDAAWQATVADDELRKAILEGGQAVGKSMMMPPNPDLVAKPDVVNGLVKIVRDFKR